MRNILGFLFSAIFLFSCDNGISFDDPALDACVRNAAPKYNDDYLTQNDLDKITVLICAATGDEDGEESGVRLLYGIERLKNLEKLGVGYSHVSDLTPLSKLKKLKIFGFTSDQKISSYEPLINLPLTFLGIHGTGLESISFLAYIPTLEEIDLERNKISDLTPIKQLPKLKKIDVSYNKITTLKPIAEHPNIENFTDISIGYNCIDCSVEEQNVVLVEEKNPEVYISCDSGDQLLPENCGE